jgi:hypothetical protein
MKDFEEQMRNLRIEYESEYEIIREMMNLNSPSKLIKHRLSPTRVQIKMRPIRSTSQASVKSQDMIQPPIGLPAPSNSQAQVNFCKEKHFYHELS